MKGVHSKIQSKVAQVFLGVSMQYQHDGLTKFLKSQNLDPEKLPSGNFFVFVNRQMNKVKVMATIKSVDSVRPVVVLAYTRLPVGMTMNMSAIQFIPQAFMGGSFNYDKALDLALRSALNMPRPKRPVGPLNAARAMRESRAL